MALVNAPVPFAVQLFAVLGLVDMPQQTPLAVTEAPPSAVTVPPPLAVVAVMEVIAVVVTVGTVVTAMPLPLVEIVCLAGFAFSALSVRTTLPD